MRLKRLIYRAQKLRALASPNSAMRWAAMSGCVASALTFQ